MVMGMETTTKSAQLSKQAVRAAASRANGAKGGRPSNLSEFLRGFAEATGYSAADADSHWAAHSRHLSDSARAKLERGGYEIGKREGGFYKSL